MFAAHAPPLAIQSNQHLSQTIPLFHNGGANSTACATALDACSHLEFGRQLHAHLHKNGFHRREFVQTKLLRMYGECGSMDDMAQVFEEMPDRNLYTYSAILNVLLDKGLFEEAFRYYERLMVEEGVRLEFFIFPVAFKICGGYGKKQLGRQLHAVAVKAGVIQHIYVGNGLIDMYGKCGSLEDSEMVFRSMFERDHISWNSIITACVGNGKVFEGIEFLEMMLEERNVAADTVPWGGLIGGLAEKGQDKEALNILRKMGNLGIGPTARILKGVLPACSRLGMAMLGKEIYGYIVRRGFMSIAYVVNGLIDLYRRCGDMETGFRVFSGYSMRDEVSFNTMIAGYCDNGEIVKAKALFDRMECEGVSKGLITWNTMISGYVDNWMFLDAVRMLTEILKQELAEPDSFTLGSALGACAEMGCRNLGKAIHSYCIVRGLETNRFVGGALVDMYCQCWDLEAAENMLYRVPERDIVIWNAFISGYAGCDKIASIKHFLRRMKDDGFEPDVYTWNGIIAGYIENGKHELALKVFSDIWASKLRPDLYTVGIVLPACSRLASVERGKQVHGYAIRSRYDSDEYVTAALIDMYSKCGIIKHARQVHDRAKSCNLVTQNVMLNAYAMNGFGQDGITFFRGMLADGFKPDSVTFLSALSLCVHAGSVDTAHEFFDMMGACGVAPTVKHYTCMVDVLSRAGRLEKAYAMAEGMPMDPDSVIWGALLGGCIIHKDFNLGEIVARKLIELEPDSSRNYVMLANLYASTGEWNEVGKIRRQMKHAQLYKNPGCSWIEDKNETHIFMASDRSHKRAKEIFDMLDNLTAQMRMEHV